MEIYWLLKYDKKQTALKTGKSFILFMIFSILCFSILAAEKYATYKILKWLHLFIEI